MIIYHLEAGSHGLLHEVSPVVVLDGHDHLVYVQQGDVLVPARWEWSSHQNNAGYCSCRARQKNAGFLQMNFCSY